jgi:hypothetical protein
LSCLQYAHEHGCPWDENTSFNAVANRRVECLLYAHKHGCPWALDVTFYDILKLWAIYI